jgi:putative spermidine/putrescine transport system substrate-binding protein
VYWHRLRPPLEQIATAGRGQARMAALVIALCLSAMPQLGHAQNTLNLATWGGAYGQSQEIVFFEPFAKETGTSIATVIYDGNLAKLKQMIESDGAALDVIDVSASALDALCKEGLLETMDAASLDAAPDGSAAQEDFLPGAVSSCGVASVAWSTAVAYNRRAFTKGVPTKISALLDTARFPGKRALPKNARYSLELALLADGVPPENVYGELGMPEGADRAFAALDKIMDDVILWDKAEQPVTWLLEDKVVMAAAYSGRLFRAAVGDRSIGILWDGQIYDFDAWAIPKSSNNKTDAVRFIRFATAPARLAEQAEMIAYGPMRKSALSLVGKHPVINIEMQPFLPTAPQNFEKALKFDDAWWRANGEALNSRFAAWQAKVEAAQVAREAARKAKEAAKDEPAKAAP